MAKYCALHLVSFILLALRLTSFISYAFCGLSFKSEFILLSAGVAARKGKRRVAAGERVQRGVRETGSAVCLESLATRRHCSS